MDIEKLLQPHGEDDPSGEDLEYDQAFTELEIAAQPGEERQVGDEIKAAEDPDYKDVSAKALAIMERSHDLRAGVFLAEAQLRLNGFTGFAKATTYIAGCLSAYWETCHPQLDADDDGDPTMRVNAVLALSDSNRILRGVRRAPLTKSRTFGALSLRDIEVAEGHATPTSDMETVPDTGQVAAAFQDTDEDELREISVAAAQALADIQEIDAAFVEHTPGQGPDLDPLIKFLKQANSKLTTALGGEVEPADQDADADGGAMAAGGAGGGPVSGGNTGSITTPNDVQNALDRIIGYYERYEPSSPLPLLLLRAKKLVSADFLTIVRDMAPSGLDNVNLIGGLEDDD